MEGSISAKKLDTISIDPGLKERDCSACNERMLDALRSHPGISDVSGEDPGNITITFDQDHCSPSCIQNEINTTNNRLELEFNHEQVVIGGIDCAGCAKTLEAAIQRVEGVTSCPVDFHSSTLRLEHESTHPDALTNTRKKISALGYSVVEEQPAKHVAASSTSLNVKRRRHAVVTTASGALSLAALIIGSTEIMPLASQLLYLAAIITGGAHVAKSGIATLIATRRPDMKFLMTIAVIGAVGIGEWFEAALVVVLFAIGEALEGYAADKARSSLTSLMSMIPSRARRKMLDASSGKYIEEEIDAKHLAIGDTVVVLPGEQITADGNIIKGASCVNQAAITGESVPVDKEPGDQVFAGTFNGESRIEVEVTSPPGDNTLDRIARAVREAQGRKAPSERWVDSFAAIYTPIVMAIALGVVFVPVIAFGGDPSTWIYRGLAFLILACPCALVISTPVAIVSALARATSNGVLIKGGQHLEAATRITVAAFDKTGTLTNGSPGVSTLVVAENEDQTHLLSIAAAIESGSEHPIAKSIIQFAAEQGVPLLGANDVQALRGFGASGLIDGKKYLIGNERLFFEHPKVEVAVKLARPLIESGHTAVIVADEKNIIGVIGLVDEIRKTSKGAIKMLRKSGVRHLSLLTGDNLVTAKNIASELDIDDVNAGLLPQDKISFIEHLESDIGRTAMIGDGVNDAPALARATLGVAMGTGGSATAIETADVALIGDDIRKLASMFTLARWSLTIVRQNIAFSLATKLIAAVLAVTGILTLWMAVLVDVGATLVVTANGIRLISSRPLFGKARTMPFFNGTESAEDN